MTSEFKELFGFVRRCIDRSPPSFGSNPARSAEVGIVLVTTYLQFS